MPMERMLWWGLLLDCAYFVCGLESHLYAILKEPDSALWHMHESYPHKYYVVFLLSHSLYSYHSYLVKTFCISVIDRVSKTASG